MKWLFIASVALLPALTYAQNTETLDLSAYQTESEMPADVFQELGSLNNELESKSEELNLGGEELDFDARHGRPNRHWRHRHRFPRPIFFQHNVCFARNGRGVTFRVSGFAPRRSVQNAALRFCERNSARPWTCRPLGCR